MSEKTVALIVGGSSGMGFESAKLIAKKGVNLHIIGRDEAKLKVASDELSGLGVSVQTTGLDLYDKKSLSDFIVKINETSEYIKYLINAAGYFKPVGFLEHTEEDYDIQLDVNKAFFFLTQAVAKNMKEHGGGSIVNIGSMWAHQSVKATPSSAYSMQKAGLHSLTQHMAMELAEFGIRVNAVAPAVVLSTIYKSFIDEDKIDETLAGFDGFHPMGRIGQASEIADSIDFLLSEKASWITGEILNVDGGVMAGRN